MRVCYRRWINYKYYNVYNNECCFRKQQCIQPYELTSNSEQIFWNSRWKLTYKLYSFLPNLTREDNSYGLFWLILMGAMALKDESSQMSWIIFLNVYIFYYVNLPLIRWTIPSRKWRLWSEFVMLSILRIKMMAQ